MLFKLVLCLAMVVLLIGISATYENVGVVGVGSNTHKSAIGVDVNKVKRSNVGYVGTTTKTHYKSQMGVTKNTHYPNVGRVGIYIPTQPKIKALLKVEVMNGKYESLTLLEPKNWIELVGGESFAIPNVKFAYNGVDKVEYLKNGKKVKITMNTPDYIVSYPFNNHQNYYPEDNVILNIHAKNLDKKTLYVYLIKTYPTQLRDAVSLAIDGDTHLLRDMLRNAVKTTYAIVNNGLARVSLGQLNPGDYVVVITLNRHDDANVTLVSTTAFEVLECKSKLNVPSSILRSSEDEYKYLEGRFEFDGSPQAKYTCIAMLIRKDADITFKLSSKGTKTTTNLTAKVGQGEAKLIEGFKIGGVGLNKINANKIKDWLRAFPSDAVGFSIDRIAGSTYDFKILLKDLSDGNYYLYVAAWNVSNPSQKVVAFNWATVNVRSV